MMTICLRNYLNLEYDRLYAVVDAFRTLLPHQDRDAAVHSGEEGRFLEELLIAFLRGKLPSTCGVGSGFIVNRSRDACSYQVDVIVYDRMRHAPILQYGNAVVVEHQSVLAAISVKRTLSYDKIDVEVGALSYIGTICGDGIAGRFPPYLALVAFRHAAESNFEDKINTSHQHLLSIYKDRPEKWSLNEVVNDLIVVDDFVIHRTSLNHERVAPKKAAFYWTGGDGVHRHYYLQLILKGISDALAGMLGVEAPIPIDMPTFGMRELQGLPVCTANRPPTTLGMARRIKRA